MVRINLLKLLKERGMTQLQLSEITGIRPSTICDMCNNNCTFLKIENINKICNKLDCSIDDFMEIVY
ncbi:MAG: helix-turn-helix transcriptional regulator [Ruminococcus sp.]|nr:helix-turn-helix transcriptional regulator [Ruminococcus sp.]